MLVHATLARRSLRQCRQEPKTELAPTPDRHGWGASGLASTRSSQLSYTLKSRERLVPPRLWGVNPRPKATQGPRPKVVTPGRPSHAGVHAYDVGSTSGGCGRCVKWKSRS